MSLTWRPKNKINVNYYFDLKLLNSIWQYISLEFKRLNYEIYKINAIWIKYT